MAYLQYTIDFKTLRKDELLQIAIFGSGNTTPSALYGAATPIVTEEDNDADLFMPVRTQTGYINIVDTGQTQGGQTFNWHYLLPSEAMDRPVVLWSSGGTVYWKGFIQCQQTESTIYEEPVERSYAIYDVLGAMEYVDFNIGISTPCTNAYVNFAYLVKQITDTLPVEVRPNNFYFQGGDNVKQHLLCKVNPMLFCDVSDGVDAGEVGTIGGQQNISELRTKYTCKEVLEEICKFWGWSCRTFNGDMYFVRDFAPSTLQGTDHAPFLEVSYSQLEALAAGTAAGSATSNPGTYTYDGRELVSTENNITDNKPIGYVSLKTDAGAYKELIKLFPERPRMALASHVHWNGVDTALPELRISHNVTGEYHVDSHDYESSVTSGYPGNIFGLRSEAEKWGTGEKYTYTYVAGAMWDPSQSTTGQMKLISRWPFNFKDCRLSMKATIFSGNGEEVTETHDDKDVFGNIGKSVAQMVMVFHAANGTDYYWNGDSWLPASATFLAYVGGSDGYIYPQSAVQKIPGAQAYYLPRKYITFETLVNRYDVQPVGRLEIRINFVVNVANTKQGLADLTVEVERTPLPSVYDSVKEEQTYLPYNGPRRSLPMQDEWSQETIFASDDMNQFGIGTVLNSDNTPLEKIQMDTDNTPREQHPEAWTVAMVYEFGRLPRQILCTEMNRAATQVAAVTPRSRMAYLNGDWYPFAICHYWRDDIKKIYAISVKRGAGQVTIRVLAGTGIASVSPAGYNLVYVGTGIRLSCVVQAGYFFNCWQNGAGTVISLQQDFTLANVTASDTITAVGVEDTTEYTVIIISNAAGVSGVSGAGKYRFGRVATINCTVASGYRFVAWTENNWQGEVISESNPFSLTVNRDITLYPLCESEGGDSWFIYFAIQQPTWGYIRDDNDQILHDGDWDEFIEGEVRRYTAVPATGYEFVKWLFNGEDFQGSTNQEIPWYYDQTTDADGILTAVFKVQTTPTNTLHLMVSQRFIDVHASLYVKIGSDAETSYSFSSTSDEQSISIPQGVSVRLRVEWDDLYYPSQLQWFNYATSSSEGSANPYTFNLNADKYLICSLQAG